MKKIILGIETSCDDTSVCLLESAPTIAPKILAHHSFSQEIILRKWGGVVPEIAARNHLQKIVPLIESALETASLKLTDINLIAVTQLPGLLGPLLTGLNAAKTLALMLKIPIYPANHLYAHLEAVHLTEANITYPYIGVLVSGGHSLFMLVKSVSDFEVLATTIDDAAGEAFDKGGKMMKLGYPAGRFIDHYASKGNPLRFPFPIGLENPPSINLSYAGLKTALRVFIEKNPQFIENHESTDFADLCASYQHAIVSALVKKLKMILPKLREDYNLSNLPIVVGGGVAANSKLRAEFTHHFKKSFFVAPQFCTDNGAMIANLAARDMAQAVLYPECLKLDGVARFINKSQES